MSSKTAISVEDLSKTFTLHMQGGVELAVVHNVSLTVKFGECVVLAGPSGIGKSSILRMIYGNYRADAGRIIVRGEGVEVDVVDAAPREIIRLRQSTIGYVSQFLRVIPRVSSLDIVKAAAADQEEGEKRARELLKRLAVPERLWSLPPATFSGGEKQRINIARGFAACHPILLLDEPTASLDKRNRQAVVELITHRKSNGAAVLGIFHDEDVRSELADRIIDVRGFAPKLLAVAN
ncbi:MAG: phosphonate C-P lyase system protein PhnL [Hyphomicrobiaceae bacterium]